LIHLLLYSGFRGLSRVENELLEIPSVYQLLELFPERATINGIVSHSVMEGAIFFSSWPLQARWEWPWVPHPILIFDGVEDVFHRDFERSEVGFLSVSLGRVP